MFNINDWDLFRIGDMFDIRPTQSYKGLSKENIDDGGETPLVVNSSENNGIGAYSSLKPTEKKGIITFSDTTEGNTFFYQPFDFIGFSHVQGMYPKDREWNEKELLFLVTILTYNSIGRYNYGRKMTRQNILETHVLLPSIRREGGKLLPDFNTINLIIEETIYNKKEGSSLLDAINTVNNTYNDIIINTSDWKTFKIEDLFEVVYGINIDLNKCEITDKYDEDSVNYVSRTSSNNGVSERVKIIPGKEPQPAGSITVAGGGSVLSTFVQDEPFYSGRDLYLLLPKYSMSLKEKLFCVTLIEANKYRYNYGRQANITLPKLEIKLPINKHNEEPDWFYINEFIDKLPYSEKLKET